MSPSWVPVVLHTASSLALHTPCSALPCRIAELAPDVFFLGAGEVDLKVGFSAADFVAAYKVGRYE